MGRGAVRLFGVDQLPPCLSAANLAPPPDIEHYAPARAPPPHAVGDIHGDINKAMRSLVMAGVASFEGGVPRWIGGDTVVVQLGDILDRGDAEIATLMLLRQLGRQAEADGGAVHILNGNHESLNVCGDFRCAPAALPTARAITRCLHMSCSPSLAAVYRPIPR